MKYIQLILLSIDSISPIIMIFQGSFLSFNAMHLNSDFCYRQRKHLYKKYIALEIVQVRDMTPNETHIILFMILYIGLLSILQLFM